MSNKIWFVRTVRNESITIERRRYFSPRPLNGLLDGKRLVFGRYRDEAGSFLPFVNLWGTVEFQHIDPDTPEGQQAWLTQCRLFAGNRDPLIGMGVPAGSYNMAQGPNGEWLNFPNIVSEFWDEVRASVVQVRDHRMLKGLPEVIEPPEVAA